MRRVNPFVLTTVSLAALSASPAFAQQTAADQSPPATLTTEQEAKSGQNACEVTNGQPAPANCTPATTNAITITGTRIRSPNLTSPLPVSSVGGQEFFQTGNVSVGDKLAQLPQITGTFTQANSSRFLGTGGLNLLDLRGLGTQRTLVLVNGRRHVGGDVLSTGVSVDVNTIPTDLIDRVDIVTGGNSAVYGSDAIAGVVNFVLKDHYNGIQIRGQGGQSTYHDADSYFVSALAGKNFADGRGNVAVNVEYARRDQSWGNRRSFFRRNLYVNDVAGGDPNVPDELLNPNFASATFSNTGTYRAGGPGTALACGTDPTGAPYPCSFIFQPDGTLVPQTGQHVGVGSGQFVGGNGEGFFSGHQIQLTPQLDRYNVNLVGHFEVSPAFVPFVEGTYSRTDTSSTGGNGPAFIISSAAQGAFGDLFGFTGLGPNARNRERIRLDNPYLTPQARQVICDARFQATGADCADDATFGIQEGLLGLGNRTEEAKRETYRIVGGVRGDLGGNWNYEVSLNYGKLQEKTKIEGNVNTQRALLAMDAVRDSSGNIVCRSQIDPTAAFGGNTYGYNYFYGEGATEAGSHFDPNAQARLDADVAACVPINVLGGNFTDAQRAYLLEDSTATGRTSQFDAMGFISGDTGKWFSLPGGPISLVLGAEYREDNLFYHQNSESVTLGYTFYNSIPTFEAPKAKVKEAFGEIRVPIVKDLPLLHELEVSGAGRVSDYNLGSTGTVVGWNANVLWAPFDGLRLRGNYAHAIRAPNQGELFTPFGQNFSGVSDPCDLANINNNPQRAANCIADGVPAGGIPQYSDSLPFLSGGNADLAEETSNSLTLGGVFTPRFVPGLSLSVDYYKIKVKNVISSVSAQFILNSCYDAPSLDNIYCSFFSRAQGAQLGHDGIAHGILNNSLHLGPINFAALVARGIDTELAYRHQIGSIGRLDTKLTWTHALERTDFTDPGDPHAGDRQLSEIGFPKDAFNWNTSLTHGRFTLGYQMRYIGKMIVYDPARGLGQYEDFYPFEGNDPLRPDLFDRKWYKPTFYHDVRLGIDVGPKYNFYIGADNVTNTKPPYNLTGSSGGNATGNGAGESIYDNIGRFYYAGFVAKF